MGGEDGRILLGKLRTEADVIKQNWTDSIGKQYILWLEQTQENIKKIEHKREILALKQEKIKLICDSINDEGDGDTPKTLALRK